MDFTHNHNTLQTSLDFPISCSDEEFTNKVAENFLLDTKKFSIFSCKEQALFSLLRGCNVQTLTIYAPSEPYIKNVASKLGIEYEYINRFIELDSTLIPNSTIFFSNPSFPDGNYYEIENLLEYWEEQNITVILDESYLPFTSKTSFKNNISTFPNLYIIESIGAFYGLKNLHLCFIHSNEQNIHNIQNHTPACHIPKNEQNLLLQAFKDNAFKKISSSITLINKELFITNASPLKCFKHIYSSDTNYMLFSIEHKYKKMFYEFLEEKNIKLHTYKDSLYLDDSFFSFTIPRNKEINLFIKYLKEFNSKL